MRPQPIIVLLAIFLLCDHTTLAAITYTWTGANSTNWTDGGNWTATSGSDYPGHSAITDIATINSATNQPTLSSNLPDSIATLNINAGSILEITGSTTLIVTGKTTVKGELNLGPLAVLNGHTTGTLQSLGSPGIIDVSATTGGSDDFTAQYNGFKTYSLSQTTANFIGASAQLISTATTFYNIQVSNTHGLSTSINIRANGTITINSGTTFTPGVTKTVVGMISGTGTLQVTRIVPGISNPDYLTSQCTSVLTLANLTVEYIGSAAQIISTKDTFGNVKINNSSGVILGSTTHFNGALNFTSGKLTLGNDTLIIGPSGSISGANGSNYIVTNGKGLLGMTTSAGATTFPVGDNYNPISINDGTGGHVFYVSVSNIVTDNSNNPVTDWAVGRTWHIISIGGATVTVTPLWNETADLAGADFDNADAFISYRDSTLTHTWTPGTGTDISGQSNPYAVTSSSITFAAGDVYNIGVGGGSLSPLPVSLFNFGAEYKNGDVNLNWITASEQNNAYFDVERSLDAATWTRIGQVKGHGTSNEMNSYLYADNLAGMAPFGSIYYRLKQVDFNGKFTYSIIRSVAVFNPGQTTIYPNPASDILNINRTDHSVENSTIRIINMKGVNVYQQSVSCNGIMQNQIDISSLPSGVYYIQIINGNGIVVNEKVVKN